MRLVLAIILFSTCCLICSGNQPCLAKKKEILKRNTSNLKKKDLIPNQANYEYPPFTCPGLKKDGYGSHRHESEPKQNLYNLPRTHLSDQQDIEQFINGNSDTLYGFDAVPPSNKRLPSAEP